VVAPHVRDAHGERGLAPYEVIRQLGSRPTAVLLARHPLAGGKAQLVVVERVPGAGRDGDEKSAELAKVARRIAAIANPNLARVREVATRGDDLIVVGDFIDGAKLAEVWRLATEAMPLEIVLRVLIDTLNGLGALHNLRDAKQQPMKLAHGEVGSPTILCAVDGTARVLYAVSRCVPGVRAEAGSAPYLAPEVESGEPFDARADVFGIGAMLWEALSGKSIVADGGARPNPVPAPAAPTKAPWAKGLVDVAGKALAHSPDGRWPTAAAMAAEIRKAAGLKLAPTSAVAAWLAKTVGEKVKARRAAVEETAAPIPIAAVPAVLESPKSASVDAAAPSAKPAAVASAASSPKPAAVASAAPSPKPGPVVVPPPAWLAVSVTESAPPSSDRPESVTVAPGIQAPVADIIELSPESAELALESVRPPPPPPTASAQARPATAPPVTPLPIIAVEGDEGAKAPTPPVASSVGEPARVPPPVVDLPDEDEKPPVSGAPLYASAIDSPPSVAVPAKRVREPMPTVPSLARQEQADRRVRTKQIILGGVAALGLAFCGLLAYRNLHWPPNTQVEPAATQQATIVAQPPRPPPPPAPSTANAQQPPPSTTPPAPPATQPAPSASVAAAGDSPSTVAATTAPPRGKFGATKPTAPATPPRPKPPVVSGLVRPKPKPKPFDPNSL
jgi:eukaryotic-like serine/threonine-protein kinase